MNTEKAARKGDGSGSFWIGREVLNLLVANANAAQICAYLTLARYTDDSGQLSTASYYAVRNAIGGGDEQAMNLLQSLTEMKVWRPAGNGKKGGKEIKLVYTAEEWKEETGEFFERPSKLSQVRYVLPQLDAAEDEAVWFGNNLVSGYGRFSQPLAKLKRLGDLPARLLLLLYRENRMDQFGGVRPSAVYFAYEMENQEVEDVLTHYELWHATPTQETVFQDFWTGLLKVKASTDQKERQQQAAPFFKAFKALIGGGFISQVVMVLDAPVTDPNASVIYELKSINNYGYTPKGEEGLGGLTARLAGYLSRPVTYQGKFWGAYAAVVEVGVQPCVVGIYRPRFRVTNSKNRGVSSAFKRIRSSQAEWSEVLERLCAEHKSEEPEEQPEEVAEPPKPAGNEWWR